MTSNRHARRPSERGLGEAASLEWSPGSPVVYGFGVVYGFVAIVVVPVLASARLAPRRVVGRSGAH